MTNNTDKSTEAKIEENKKVTGKKTKNKLLPYILITIGATLAAVIAALSVFVVMLSKEIVCEVLDTPDYSHVTENPFANSLCKIDTALDEIDTSVPCETEVPLKFFGFIKKTSKLTIVDTVSPEITSTSVVASLGVDLTADMFVTNISDNTETVLKMDVENPVGIGEYTVNLTATDLGGNVTSFTEKLTVIDTSEHFSFEYGIDTATVKDTVLSTFAGIETAQFPEEILCGDHIILGENGESRYFALVTIKDTQVPEVIVESFDILLGMTIPEDDFVISITDYSPVTTEFLSFPDYTKSGEYLVDIRFTDSFGNVTEATSTVRVHDVETEITAEKGSSVNELSDLVFKDKFSRNSLSFENANAAKDLPIGTSEIKLVGDFGFIPVDLTVTDTVAPEVTVKQVNYLLGTAANVDDFIVSYSDMSKVEFSFKTAPDSSKEGIFDVTVVAEDEGGNKTEKVAKVNFYVDNVAPVISGYRNYSLKCDESADFSQGVTAHDTIWGDLKVTVDSSAVDLSKPGTYPLKYSAVDGSGNVAEIIVDVVINEPVYVKLDVNCIMQKPSLPNGCEVVSLTMALGYKGCNVNPVWLFDNFMPTSPFKEGDPWETYVGNPKINPGGYGCFAPVVVKTGNDYLASIGSSLRVTDVSYKAFSSYTSYIDNGVPVIVWGTLNMKGKTRIVWEDEINGKTVSWLAASHCLVLIGYTDYTYIFADPLKGIVEYSKEAVEYSFNLNHQQACVVQ